MGNPERGEVDLEVGGTRYRLALGMAGLRQLQAAVSTPGHRVTFMQAVDAALKGDIEYLLAMIWAACQRHHPELTQADVDRLIDELGGIQALPVLLGTVHQLMAATDPDARDQGQLKKTGPTAPAPVRTSGTTGPGSISKRARSA